MKEYVKVLADSRLFKNVKEDEVAAMLKCLDARKRDYQKGEYILQEGDLVKNIAVLVRGRALVQKEDYWGNRSIVKAIQEGEVFAQNYAAPDSTPIINDVLAEQASTVIFFDVARVLSTCSNSCQFHANVVRNLFATIAEGNRMLAQKIEFMSKRSTREKLLSYLSMEAKRQGKDSFEIPFNRQQMADFLSVDRSAMSNELGKLRDEGLLEFDKNHFTLNR